MPTYKTFVIVVVFLYLFLYKCDNFGELVVREDAPAVNAAVRNGLQVMLRKWCALIHRRRVELIDTAANHRNTRSTLVKIDLRFIDEDKVLRGMIFCFFFPLYFEFSYLLHHLQFISFYSIMYCLLWKRWKVADWCCVTRIGKIFF